MKNLLKRLIDRFTEETIPDEATLITVYREMPPAAFNKISPSDLTASARKCYEAEARRRTGSEKPKN